MPTPGVPHTQYVYMCICIYVFTFIRAACGYCYATLVSPRRAPFYCCLYTLYAPNNYILSNPVVVVHWVCCLVQTNPGPLCSSRSRYERAPPLHIPRLHIECIYCATYILCAYRSFSFSFRITLPFPPLRSLPVTSIVQPQWHGSCRGSEIMQRQQNNASASKQCNQGEMYTRSASPSSGGSSVPLYSASHHCCKLLCGARQGIMPLLFIWAVYKRIMPLMQRLRPRWW